MHTAPCSRQKIYLIFPKLDLQERTQLKAMVEDRGFEPIVYSILHRNKQSVGNKRKYESFAEQSSAFVVGGDLPAELLDLIKQSKKPLLRFGVKNLQRDKPLRDFLAAVARKTSRAHSVPLRRKTVQFLQAESGCNRISPLAYQTVSVP